MSGHRANKTNIIVAVFLATRDFLAYSAVVLSTAGCFGLSTLSSVARWPVVDYMYVACVVWHKVTAPSLSKSGKSTNFASSSCGTWPKAPSFSKTLARPPMTPGEC